MQFILLSHVSCYFFNLFSPCNLALHGLSTLHFLTPLHDLSTRRKFHIMWVPKSPFYGPQNSIFRIKCGKVCTSAVKSTFRTQNDTNKANGVRRTKNTLSLLFYLIRVDLNGEKLPIVCLSVWLHLISFFSKINGFRVKMCQKSKIDLFIRYNFCRKYFFPRSMFIIIKCKNLLKTFLFSFDLKNQICGYFHHHIRNQHLKIREVLFGSLSD